LIHFFVILGLPAAELISPTTNNGSFETLSGATWVEANIEQDSSFANEGSNYAVISATASGTRGARDGFEQVVPINSENGRKLTLTFYARNGAPGMKIVSGTCTIADAEGQSVSTTRIITNQPEPIISEWTRYEFVRIISKNFTGSGTVEVYIGLGLASGTTIGETYYGFIDNVTLTQEQYPRLSIQKSYSSIEIDFDGEIHESTELSSWDPVSPQPSSPWLLENPTGSKFFKVTE
jgi:hypothetical protein